MILDVQATSEEVMRAVEALQEFGRANGVQESALFALALVLEECGSNIVNHVLPGAPGHTFQVSLERKDDAFFMELRDRGPEFDPTPKMNQAIVCDEKAHGGWGLPLVRRYIDEIRYRREDGENVLQLVKCLTAAPAQT